MPAFPNLTDAIFDHAEKHPKLVALEDVTGRLTYKQFANLIGRASVWLRSLGIEAGQPIGVRLTNSADHLILSLALMRIGAAKVEFGIGSDGKQFDATVRALNVTTLFIEPPAKAIGNVRCITIDAGWRRMLAGFKGDCRHDAETPEPSDILLSSGSTGPAKGVPCTHRMTLGRLADWYPAWHKAGMVSEDYSGSFLLASSMSFSGFLTGLLSRLVTGGKIVILPEFAKLLDFVRAIQSHEDAILIVTPGMCQELLSCAPDEGLLFPDMRCIICTGTPLPAQAKRDAIRSLTPNFTEMYGNAGAGLVAALYPEDIPGHADSVGRVLSTVAVEVVDGDGRPVGPNVAGHLRCKGGGVADDLIGNSGSGGGLEGVRDGWYYSGDLAAIDDEGYLHLKGRAADAVVRRGVQVFPAIVEMALMSHPDVREAVVLGIGQGADAQVVAVVRAAMPPPEPKAMLRYCIDQVGNAQTPNHFMLVKEMPRTAAGKIDRAKVKALVVKELEGVRRRADT
ncbi:class I adenylate-forming enzyme family protein [Emcibacter sp. SYSU 3D8]|uniref:class I adenylate-forming enzyme family protein n=1 Tax=Emcibacter sp. SYSU 3D8 TaxID=3133969 RepID=UPI0031FE93C9